MAIKPSLEIQIPKPQNPKTPIKWKLIKNWIKLIFDAHCKLKSMNSWFSNSSIIFLTSNYLLFYSISLLIISWAVLHRNSIVSLFVSIYESSILFSIRVCNTFSIVSLNIGSYSLSKQTIVFLSIARASLSSLPIFLFKSW